MANYTHRDRIVRTVEYAVPSGNVIDEFEKAFAAAQRAWLDRHKGEAVPGDWARVEARDDEVVICFDVEEKPGEAEATLGRVREAFAETLLAVRTVGKVGEDGLIPLRRAIHGEG